jgi:hypothetical protein
MAESLCDELVRVEEDILALEPLLRYSTDISVPPVPVAVCSLRWPLLCVSSATAHCTPRLI